MTSKTNIRIAVAVCFFIIYFIIWVALSYIFNDLNMVYKGMIAAFGSVILSPRIKYYKTQSGSKMQVVWLFSKRPLIG